MHLLHVHYILKEGLIFCQQSTHLTIYMYNVIFCVSVCDGPFSAWNIVLIVLGVVFFIVGVIIAIILVLLLLLRVKNSDGEFVRVCGRVCVCASYFAVFNAAIVKLWYKILLTVAVVITIISLILWLALIGYTASNGEC